jgi:hypothetical protein
VRSSLSITHHLKPLASLGLQQKVLARCAAALEDGGLDLCVGQSQKSVANSNRSEVTSTGSPYEAMTWSRGSDSSPLGHFVKTDPHISHRRNALCRREDEPDSGNRSDIACRHGQRHHRCFPPRCRRLRYRRLLRLLDMQCTQSSHNVQAKRAIPRHSFGIRQYQCWTASDQGETRQM